MSNVTFDLQWKEGVMELLDHLEAETADDEAETDTKGMAEWACIYIKYLQNFKKLEACYDGMVHPQKRILIKEILVTVMTRIGERSEARRDALIYLRRTRSVLRAAVSPTLPSHC